MHQRTTRSSPARGFTLIELMIVVAIIGILSSIAIPGFVGFTARSKTTEAPPTMRMLARSLQDYFHEHNFQLPPDPSATAFFAGINPPTPDGTPATATGARKQMLFGSAAPSGWQYINVSVDGFVYFHYYIAGSQGGGNPPEFTVYAVTDLDNDGNPCTRSQRYMYVGNDWLAEDVVTTGGVF